MCLLFWRNKESLKRELTNLTISLNAKEVEICNDLFSRFEQQI